jgi:hypothetical protein
MNNENVNLTEQPVIAIAKSGSRLKAVELHMRGSAIEITRTKSSEENVNNWQDFAVKCDLSIEPVTEEVMNQKSVVVGYDSAGTAFSRVNIPAVDDKEIDSMVQLQAESRLPLPADQMELAWRADKGKDGQLAITIAAARRQQVQHFINKIISFKPVNIFLDCEGIVKIWKEIFSGNEKNAVIINADDRNTQICLVQKGQLINAVALDMGVEDFTGSEVEIQTENIERFVQDTRSVVDLFGVEKSEKLPVYVLSDGSATYSDLASSLKDADLNAAIARPDINKFSAKSRLSLKEIFEYKLQIGLALMVIDANDNELNLFKNLYKPFGEEKQKHWLYSPKIAGAIAAATLILFLGVSYAIDLAKPESMKKTIEAAGQNLTTLVERQNVLTAIERKRPDLLKIISYLTMNEDESAADRGGRGGPMNRGRIQLDSFDYKRGKKITITGTASDNETLYNFEDQLKKKPGITDVTWTPTQNRSSTRTTSGSTPARSNLPTRTAGTNPRGAISTRGPSGMSGFGPESVKFSMEFHYGSFTKSER